MAVELSCLCCEMRGVLDHVSHAALRCVPFKDGLQQYRDAESSQTWFVYEMNGIMVLGSREIHLKPTMKVGPNTESQSQFSV